MGLIKFFDKLEDKVRRYLSRRPISYGFIGGVGVVLFWRGIWHLADFFSLLTIGGNGVITTVNFPQFLDGFISALLGAVFTLMSGLFVSNFIGNEIIISGLRGEKKLAEKTEVEVKTEAGAISDIQEKIQKISERLTEIEKKL